VAFCVSAGFDWVWQIPVLPIVFLLLGSVLVTAGPGVKHAQTGLRPAARIAFAAIAVAAIAVVVIPYTSERLVRESQADARAGNLDAALSAAGSARNVQPDAATPRLQEALVLESLDDLQAAAAAARAATERESTNWRTWLVLSRIEARLGRAQSAVADYRRARSLNPNSSLFR
jgi:tetratricopeptide (TPR) repeat protein